MERIKSLGRLLSTGVETILWVEPVKIGDLSTLAVKQDKNVPGTSVADA